MNPIMFCGSKVNEDPQNCLDEVYSILYSKGVSFNEKADVGAYKIKDVAQTCYSQ